MLKVYCATLSVGDKATNHMYKPSIHPERIASIMKKLLAADLENKLLLTKALDGVELNRAQIVVLTRLVHSCECFAVGHEMGHIIISRTKSNIMEMEAAKKIVEEFLEPIKELKDNEKKELLEPWTEEICADLIGLQLTLSIPEVEPYKHWGNYKSWLCSGAEISRSLDMMMQEYKDRLNNGKLVTFVNTHPHDYLRLQAIRGSQDYIDAKGIPWFGESFSVFSKVIDFVLGIGEK
jgi:hypothetical protein